MLAVRPTIELSRPSGWAADDREPVLPSFTTVASTARSRQAC